MFSDIVLDMKPVTKEDIDPFEEIIEGVKHAKGVKQDTDLDVDDLKTLVVKYKAAVLVKTGKEFPQNPDEQLW